MDYKKVIYRKNLNGPYRINMMRKTPFGNRTIKVIRTIY
jgi:hypothetical protein